MDSKIKTDWLEALRSGDYKQDTGQLRSTDFTGNEYFCCLGVLCELAVGAGIVERAEIGYTEGDGFQELILPRNVMEWAKLEDENPDLDVDFEDEEMSGRNTNLAAFNDEWGYNFDQIADLIENHL